MKTKITQILSLLIFTLAHQLISTSSFAQAPQKMSYQAVIRDANNKLVTSHAVGIQVNIFRSFTVSKITTNTLFYTETQTPTTNTDGLISIVIGGGTGFDTIKWANGTYMINTQIDPTGGTNYTISGTTQLLSVPYAFNAKTANCHYIGEHYGGGIVFYVYDNGQHGLIADTVDLSTGIRWDAGTEINTMAFSDGIGAGKSNTDKIITSQSYGDGNTYAARLSSEYSVTIGGVTYGDWYLPSKFELNLLYLHKSVVGGFSSNLYWSSTDYNTYKTWFQYFDSGNQDNGSKVYTNNVRAIRAF